MGKKKKGKIKPFKFNYPLIDRLKDQKIEQKELVDVFSTSISMNLNILDVLNDSKTTEEKRVAILQNNFDYIIDEVSNQRNGYMDLVNAVFLNSTNIVIFINIAKSKFVTDSCRRVVDKMCFDYYSVYGEDQNYINLLQLSEVVNANILPGLLGVLNNRKIANELAIARYSDISTMRCVRNINGIIIQYNLDLQCIVNVYSKLFDSVTDIFMGVIFDVDVNCLQNVTYSNISNATLYILDSLPSEDIKRVLYVYLQNIKLWNNQNVRFSLNCISTEEFPKVCNVVKYLREVEKIYLP